MATIEVTTTPCALCSVEIKITLICLCTQSPPTSSFLMSVIQFPELVPLSLPSPGEMQLKGDIILRRRGINKSVALARLKRHALNNVQFKHQMKYRFQVPTL
jgi:hypothetical protein